jgi:hypothetical protein
VSSCGWKGPSHTSAPREEKGGGGARSGCIVAPAPLSRPQPQRGWMAYGVWRAKKGEILSKIFALPWPPPCCLPPVTSACCQCLRWCAWERAPGGGAGLFFAFGAVPRSARLAAVRVSFQHPGHAQCAPSDIEAADDAMLSAPNCLMHSIHCVVVQMVAERAPHRCSTAGAHVCGSRSPSLR